MPEEADGCKVTVRTGRPLKLSNKKKCRNWKTSVIKANTGNRRQKNKFQGPEYMNSLANQGYTGSDCPTSRKRLFKTDCGYSDSWSVTVKTEINIGQTILSIQSIVQIQNHFDVPIEVYYKNNKDIKSCGVVSPESNFCVPLATVYTSAGEFLFKPVYEK
ncbi:unnamed protein product [Mytilus edulis]|uniref:Uncharacterized protein n=1 Tax=Mytilus edulis TaxID=6550 RepID=A0A8S3S2M4_MYTED|nr:unnamed protein product [Mytilus edulis]